MTHQIGLGTARPSAAVVNLLSLLALLALIGACSESPPEQKPAVSPSATIAVTPDPLTVETTSGRLEGVSEGGVRTFLGVRYAEPPTGPRRWQLPEPAAKAEGTVNAARSGARCPQTATATTPASTSEDCLFLDVTVPSAAQPGQKLPVMVWWHGGGYTNGAGSDYDATRLAERGQVVVVTVNYRLGVFGYLSLPGLEGSGTFGLADQILATRWARQNAAAFGGDPQNVTVFGESAGAMSACAVLTSPEAEGLADKVAMSSGGSCMLSWPENGLVLSAPAQTPYVSLAAGEKLGLAEAKKLDCQGEDPAGCLRGKPVEELLEISPRFYDVLAYGTPLLPTDPAQALQEGKAPPVPVLSSVNRDEARAFVGAAEEGFTAKTYPGYVAAAYPGQESEVLAQYPLEKYDSPALAWSALITDGSWACPTLTGNSALAAGGSPVYAAEFADPHAPDINRIGTSKFDPAAAHGNDLPYLFDLGGENALATAKQSGLADIMVDYWTSFARDGVPTAENAAPWPVFTGPGGPTLRLHPDRVEPVDFATQHHCAFWAGR